MAEILIVYSSVDGQTRRICARLEQILSARSHHVTLRELGDALHIDVRPFEKVIVGASVRYGRHRRHVHRFFAEHGSHLQRTETALFSVNLVARKPGRDTPGTNPYLRRLLEKIRWRPRHLAVFAGRLDYDRYRFWDRQMIRLIMKITGGPTAHGAVAEYTDWGAVEAFGRLIAGR